jgi:hypothetical protein
MTVKTETFTPGPWTAEMRYVESKYNGRIASCEAGTVRPYEIAEANARLIAAAPELLEICQAILDSEGDTSLEFLAILGNRHKEDLQSAINKALGK